MLRTGHFEAWTKCGWPNNTDLSTSRYAQDWTSGTWTNMGGLLTNLW